MNNIYNIQRKRFQANQATALEAIAYHAEQLEIAKITHSVFQQLASRAERGDNLEALRLEAVEYLKARKEGIEAVRRYA